MADFPAHVFRMDGDVGAIRGSAVKWSTFGTAATEAAGQITALDTSGFVGPEGDLFREGLDKDMPPHLRVTGDAFGIVSKALDSLAGTLSGLQDRMRPLANKAPGLWQALQNAKGRVDRAAAADTRHVNETKDLPADAPPDTYTSDSTAAGGALGDAQRQWDDCVGQANGLRGELTTAVNTCVGSIRTAKEMRFKENPKWYDIGGHFTNFVRENKDFLKQLSSALKIVSLVAGLLSFIPVLAPIMGPIALGAGLLAAGIDLAVYAGTGEGSLKMVLIDIGLNLLPGVGKLAKMGMGAMQGTRVAMAFSSVATRGRNMMSVARWGLNAPRLNGVEALKRLVRLDPIDIVSGDMVLSQTDVRLPGALPLLLSRTHLSSYRLGSWFGRSWASTLDERLEVDADGVYVATADGMTLIYPLPVGDESVLPIEGPRWRLARTADEFTITDPARGSTRHYALVADGQSHLAAISDHNGRRIEIGRDLDGVPVEVRHSGGYRVAVDVEEHRVVAFRLLADELDESTADVVLMRFGYDESGDLTEVINSSGSAQRFGYDIEGRITGWVDRNGCAYDYEYDEDGRCVATRGTGGYLTGRLRYDTDARTTTVVDSLGHATTYRFNELYQVEAVTDPIGAVSTFRWDRYDRKLAETDALGRTTRWGYDDAGNVTEIVRADGARTQVVRTSLGHPSLLTGPDGATWQWEYDERGNVTATVDPAGAWTRFRYDERGHLVESTDPLRRRTVVMNNAAGLPTAVVDATGAATTYERDRFGRPVAVTDPAGAVTRFVFTTEGQLSAKVLPDGAEERWEFDGEGNLRLHVDAAGNATQNEFGAFDVPIARTGPDGGRYTFAYDTELRLVAVTNPQGRSWRYEYDPAGRLVAETDFNGRKLGYSHDPAGQLVARGNGLGQTIEYERDPLGQVTVKRTPEGEVRFTYDPAGRLIRASGAAAELEYVRDPLGRVLAETCNGLTVTSEYDAAGHRTLRSTPSGRQSRWTYDEAGRPVELHTSGQSVRFGYDEAGREVSRWIGSAQLAQSWDTASRLTGQTLTSASAGQLGRRRYKYRPDGYLTGVEDLVTGTRRLDLDPAGRVTAVTGAGWTERYAYDTSGNLTTASWPGSDEDAEREYDGTLLRRAGSIGYAHDGQGRVVSRVEDGRTWRFEWASDDRLTTVTTGDGATWRYSYDPLGRRIGKRRLGGGDGGIVVERIDFVWDGSQLVEQREPDRATVWDWVPGGYQPVAQTELAGVDARFYGIVTDLVGQPTELVTPEGALAWQSCGSIWGALSSVAVATVDCPLRLPGQYHDAESGLHYNYLRYYDPRSARYQSADPLGLAPAPDPHGYVLNPTRMMDPLGLTPYPISMDDAVAMGAQHVDDGARIITSGSGGYQFISHSVDAAGDRITKIARFDINPNSAHVQGLGPHLNLETQINGVTVRNGPLADPHLPIDPGTIRPGDIP